MELGGEASPFCGQGHIQDAPAYSFILLVPGSELLLCTSRVASPRADTCWVENLPWSIHFTVSLRHQSLVRAPEPGAGIRALWEGLTTSVFVLFLWGSQWSQAQHSDTDPATNWAWIMGHGQICPFPSSSDSKVGAAK